MNLKSIILLFLFFLTNNSHSFSQRFGNEWINYGQPYLKLVVNTKGIYRVTKADLFNANFDTTNINPNRIQVLYRGKEIAINMVGEIDNRFDPSDYVEFYAMDNDGKMDEDLYQQKTRPHPYYSLHSNETAYFLTIGSSNGKRMAAEPTPDNTITADNYFFAKSLSVYDSTWSFLNIWPIQTLKNPLDGVGNTYWSRYSTFPAKIFNNKIALPNLAKNIGLNPVFEAMVCNNTKPAKTIIYDLNNITGSVEVTETQLSNKIIKEIPNITNDTISVIINSTGRNSYDGWLLYYTLVKYPCLPIFKDNYEYELGTKPIGLTRLQLINTPNSVYGYEITDIENQKKLNITNTNSSADIYISNTNSIRKIWLASNFKTPKSISKIVFTAMNPALFDYLMITDSRTKSGALRYKAYRESTQGGNYKVYLAETQNLYDEFSYGERNPVAIKRLADFMTNTNQIKFLFLIGRAYSYPPNIKRDEIKGTPSRDFVPTFSFPGSDIQLTSGLNGYLETIPLIPTGRLAITNDTEIDNYLAKVVEHESRTNSDWQKNQLQLAGPRTITEYEFFYSQLEASRNLAIQSTFGSSVSNYETINMPLSSWNQPSDGFVTAQVNQDFYDKVNSGVGIINYLGHGSSSGLTHNIGYVSSTESGGTHGPTKYLNKGKYPILIAMGCAVANCFSGLKDLASDWVNTADRGAIVTYSQAYLSYEEYDSKNVTEFYKSYFGYNSPNAKTLVNYPSMIDKSIGEVVQKTLTNMAINNIGADPNGLNVNQYLIANMQQSILLGDPAIKVLKPTAATPLPVTMIGFDLFMNQNKVILNWQTTNEFSFFGFEIERSDDGKIFNKIGFELAKNTKNELNTYDFVDTWFGEDLIYYRLKLIDNDGKIKYSIIKSIAINAEKKELKIYQNPIKNGEFKFELPNYLENSALLVDGNGRKIEISISPLGKNKAIVSFKMDIPKGIYILSVSNLNGARFSNKLIIE